MDVIGTDEPVRRQRPDWLADRSVRLVGAAALLTTLVGTAAATRVEEPVVPPAEIGVVFDGGEVVEQGAGVTGDLVLLLVNRSDRPADLVGLALQAPGLQLLSVRPPPVDELEPFEQRRYVLRYEVRDCALLALPGSVRLLLDEPGEPRRQQSVPLAAPAAGRGVPFAPCPATAEPPALAVRALGGDTRATPAGARGEVLIEVRNGGPTLRLLSVTAEVPGVVFTPLGPPNGVTLLADERLEVLLGFRIDDCALLRRTGRLVLRTSRAGVPSDLGLTITNDREAGTLRQVALDRVLQACPR